MAELGKNSASLKRRRCAPSLPFNALQCEGHGTFLGFVIIISVSNKFETQILTVGIK